MRYHIDTIPLWDAVKLSGECPLCALKRKNELMDVERFLGASVMEPDVRIQVNAAGFCSRHLAMLFEGKNRLGLALMLHTHLKETEKKVETALTQAQENRGQGILRRLKRDGSSSPAQTAARELEKSASSCVICQSLQEHMERYCRTLFHLWEHDAEFKRAFSQSKGVCIPHAAQLLSLAEESLPARDLDSFVRTLAELVTASLSRVEKDLKWFTEKFDYRNQSKPWGESRDSVERACNKLRGWCVGDEPYPEEK